MPTNEGSSGVSNCYVFKSRLQEYAQKVGLPTPVYETMKEGPSHEPLFRSTVVVNDVRYDSLPGFYNRKAAEQSAAEVALVELAESSGDAQCISVPVHETGLCKNLLQEYAQKMNYAIPLYECQKDDGPGGGTLFLCTVEIGGIRYTGAAAKTKKETEIKAARTALLAIQSKPSNPSCLPGGNSQLTVLPGKKREIESVKKVETPSALKPKKTQCRKRRMPKPKLNGVAVTNILAETAPIHTGIQVTDTVQMDMNSVMNPRVEASDISPFGGNLSASKLNFQFCTEPKKNVSHVYPERDEQLLAELESVPKPLTTDGPFLAEIQSVPKPLTIDEPLLAELENVPKPHTNGLMSVASNDDQSDHGITNGQTHPVPCGNPSNAAVCTEARIAGKVDSDDTVKDQAAMEVSSEMAGLEQSGDRILASVSNCYVFKSRLQEYAQKVGLPTPVYETMKEGPSHEPLFRSTVVVNDVRYDSLPGFYNRKAAEQSAAEVALVELAESSGDAQCISVPVHETGLCKNLLQEYAQKMNYAIPLYECQKDDGPGGGTLFLCTVEIGGIRYTGAAAKTKKETEIKAARTALLAIQSKPSNPSCLPGGNSQLTVLPGKKREIESVKKVETPSALKPKKTQCRKRRMPKPKLNGVAVTNILAETAPIHTGIQVTDTVQMDMNSVMNPRVEASDISPFGGNLSASKLNFQFCTEPKKNVSHVYPERDEQLLAELESVPKPLTTDGPFLAEIQSVPKPLTIDEPLLAELENVPKPHTNGLMSVASNDDQSDHGITNGQTHPVPCGNPSNAAVCTEARIAGKVDSDDTVKDQAAMEVSSEMAGLEQSGDRILASVSNCYVFKSRLQEYAQKVGLPTPVYETMKEGPSHEPLFRSTVVVNDVRYDSLPGFYNRKAAEQSAAEVALVELAESSGDAQCISVPVHETGLCKNLLQEYAQKMNYAIPLYECQKDDGPGGGTLFLCTVEIGGIRYTGAAAKTKKETEIKAARTALLAIQSKPSNPSCLPGGNSQLTVLPGKKREIESVKKVETPSALKPKKTQCRKRRMPKPKLNGVAVTNILAETAPIHTGIQVTDTVQMDMNSVMNPRVEASDISPFGGNLSASKLNFQFCTEPKKNVSHVYPERDEQLLAELESVPKPLTTDGPFLAEIQSVPKPLTIDEPLLAELENVPKPHTNGLMSVASNDDQSDHGITNGQTHPVPCGNPSNAAVCTEARIAGKVDSDDTVKDQAAMEVSSEMAGLEQSGDRILASED